MRITKRKARKEALDNGFRSKFEFEFYKKIKGLKLKVEYESEKIHYIQPQKNRTYVPDWKINTGVFIETKGLFTAADRKKILLVREYNPKITVYLLFQNSKVTLSKTSKTSYGDWCDKNGIIWADIRDIRKWKGWFK